MSWTLMVLACSIGVRIAGQSPAQPQITLGPGLRPVPDYRKVSIEPKGGSDA